MFKIPSFKQFITEEFNKTLIIVDIQPAYSKNISFDIPSFCEYVDSFSTIEVFYNGEDLGMDSVYDIQNFYMENGMEEETIDNMNFFEKNYAFFRDLMDEGVDDEVIVELGKLLIGKKIWDWRDLDDDDYETFCSIHDIDYDRDSYNFNIPDVLFHINKLPDNCILVGGGEYECLREVELCFMMLDKPYSLNHKYIY